MKRLWPRILSAFLTSAVGLFAASIVPVFSLPSLKAQLTRAFVEVKAQPTPLQIFEIPRPLVEPKESQVSASPYDIKRYVDEHDEYGLSLQHFWRRLGIKTEDWEKYVSPEAEIFPLQLDNRPGDELMLRLYDDFHRVSRFVIFRPLNSDHGKQTKWQVLGYLDFFGQKEYPPKHRVEAIGNQRWLVLRSVRDRGAGVAIFYDTWYEIKRSSLKEVLDYPAHGSVGFTMSNVPLIQMYEAKVLKTSVENGVAFITIRFSVSYNVFDSDDVRVFDKEQTAVFARRAKSDRFLFDSSRSGLSGNEFKAIYRHDSLSSEVFLKYNYGELKRLARRGNAKQKEWLRNYLDDCDESLEKQSLRKALEMSSHD